MDPQANLLDQAGSRKRILRVWQTAYLNSVGKHVEFMQFGKDGLRPLIWLHSIDYPMAPPWGLCVDAADRGFSIVSIRRPGFGGSSAATDTDEEVRILSAFLEEAGFDNAVLIIEGTSRPAGLKLAMSSQRIAFTILARPAFSAGSFGDLEPWFRDLILQTMQTRAGASLSLGAITQIGRRSGHEWLYGQFLKGEKDPAFVRNHARDLAEAWQCVRSMKAETFQREVWALRPDPALTPGALAGLAGVAVIGAETHPEWRAGFEARAAELGIPAAMLPVGSLFALYQNPDALLALIAERA
ncbi:MAG: alpha/beta fold hydrolase [Hyphomonas sp.]